MLLSMFTGIRIGECCALMVEDIDLKRKTIHINKTMSRGELGDTKINPPKTKAGIRTLYVNDEIVSFLREVIGDKKSGLLFRCTNGNLLTTNLVNYPYTKVMKEYHIIDQTVYGKIDLHSLRHPYVKLKTKKFEDFYYESRRTDFTLPPALALWLVRCQKVIANVIYLNTIVLEDIYTAYQAVRK